MTIWCGLGRRPWVSSRVNEVCGSCNHLGRALIRPVGDNVLFSLRTQASLDESYLLAYQTCFSRRPSCSVFASIEYYS